MYYAIEPYVIYMIYNAWYITHPRYVLGLSWAHLCVVAPPLTKKKGKTKQIPQCQCPGICCIHPLFLSFSYSLALPLSLPPWLSLALSLSLFFSFSLFLSASLSLSLSHARSLFLPVSFSLFLSLSLSLSLFLSLSLSVFISLARALSTLICGVNFIPRGISQFSLRDIDDKVADYQPLLCVCVCACARVCYGCTLFFNVHDLCLTVPPRPLHSQAPSPSFTPFRLTCAHTKTTHSQSHTQSHTHTHTHTHTLHRNADLSVAMMIDMSELCSQLGPGSLA